MKFIKFCFLLYLYFAQIVICMFLKSKVKLFSKIIQESSMSLEQLIITKGYKLEIHFVQTEDGYILKLFRILPKTTPKINKSVLMQHGLFVNKFNTGFKW